MKTKLMFPVCLALALLAQGVEIPVAVRQNWPWDGRVFIDAQMPQNATNDLSLVAKFTHGGVYVETTLFDLPGLTGDLWCCTGGLTQVVWDPAAGGFTNAIEGLEITANAVSPEARTWLVLDTTAGTYEFVAKDAAPTNAAGWPWQDDVYKYQKMVFRRVPAGKYIVGYTPEQSTFLKGIDGYSGTYLSAREVEITSDYYISIFKMTRGNMARVYDQSVDLNEPSVHLFRGNLSTGITLPAGATCFVRGSNSVEGINWPDTKFAVSPNSVLARFRARWQNRFMIDLPTSAQWQIAARPDAQWLWYETPQYGGGAVGDSAETLSNVVATICQAYSPVGNLWQGPSIPGKFQPNRFGVYDVVASRPDITLNQYVWNDIVATAPEVDPVGGNTRPDTRIMHDTFVNGMKISQWGIATYNTRPTDTTSTVQSDLNESRCCRFVIHLKPPKSFGGKWE